jgi:8-amino-7-oxononanoate synthase
MKGFEKELGRLRERGLLRKLVCVDGSSGARIVIRGKTFLDFSSNDYLNLSAHPEIIRAASVAIKKYGMGSGASRLLSGTRTPHARLEKRLAAFKKTRAALVFNSGYAANAGIIPAITSTDSIIFSDELNHASIVDGVRLSGADAEIYRHRDLDHLETLLRKSSGRKKKRRLIVTDSVFSMDGDMAPLKDLVTLSGRYDALLMVDDAHGTGVLGEKGRGAFEHYRVGSKDIIHMGTLSKAAGCFGGYVAGSGGLISLLVNRARSLVYSTSLPPAVVEACITAIDIIEHGSAEPRRSLWENRERLVRGLQNLGYDTLQSETPIVPVLAGDVRSAVRMGRYLYARGIFAPAIRPPTVPPGRCRLRFSVTAAHSAKDLDYLLECMKRMRSSKRKIMGQSVKGTK